MGDYDYDYDIVYSIYYFFFRRLFLSCDDRVGNWILNV
jgi:hypothetical protein